ncbi:hypothetical protein VTN02DRAFT_1464 [Thermoascus thermophilus]
MSQNPLPTKSKWGVGSFLQQAVAGVESKLDIILANEEDLPPKSAPGKAKPAEDSAHQGGASAQKSAAGSLSRSSSSARKNDRLQERLARAVVGSGTRGSLGNRPSPSAGPSRPSSPLAGNNARSSLDSSTGTPDESIRSPSKKEESSSVTSSAPRTSHDSDIPLRTSKESQRDARDLQTHEETTNGDGPKEQEESADSTVTETRDSTDETFTPGATGPLESSLSLSSDQDATVAQLQAEHRAAEKRWQEEMHEYIERIDALQSKLKYLAKEAAESAKKAAESAEPGSVEKQLLEKDERIALLLEEGQKLSKTELDHRTAIKKLRQQLAETTKSQAEAKKRADKLEMDLSNAEARARRAEAAEKRANESLSSQTKTAKDLEAVTAERDALTLTVQDMKAQLSRAVARAEAAEEKAQSDALGQERRQVAELKDELSNAKIEREISEEKLKRKIRDLEDGIEREKERARVLEAELKGEQSVLESKMESLRSRAEEASSSAAGDAQAKLLRQIETLQTQYAVASENWQTLEGSLLSRLANIEKERDEIARREGDLRRKAREVNLKAKKAEEELENSKELIQELERSLEESRQEVQRLEQRLEKANEDLKAAKREFVEQQKISDATWTQRLEEEKAKWREQALPPPAFLQQPQTDSPITVSSRKSFGLEPIPHTSELRPTSRRSSTLPSQYSDIGTPPRQNSFPPLNQLTLFPHVTNGTLNPATIGTPSITFEPDEIMSGSGRPRTPSTSNAAPTHRSGINDIISVSTVGAGPSVQLVERMSATVRRLESERAASKDELARLTAQRDEARQEVVELMREVEAKRKTDARVKELEAQMEDLDRRYQTTLEMLGEKSEQVEELQADIADLKKIYRELVDSTMK